MDKAMRKKATKESRQILTQAAMESLCEQHGLCCCVVWEMRAGRLVMDIKNSFSGSAPGFVSDSTKVVKAVRAGKGVIGRVWSSRSCEHTVNVQNLSVEAFARHSLAMEHNIRSRFAIFEAEHVYEFFTTKEMASAPLKSVHHCL